MPSTESSDQAGKDSGESDAPAVVVGPVARSEKLPDGRPVRCPAPTSTVRTAAELIAALANVRPGASIRLADGIYTGAFVAKTSGTADSPIWLCGGPGAVLDGGGIKKGYGLHLAPAQHWRIVGFTIRNAQKGLVADGTSGSVVQDLTVTDIGDEAIHLRSGSTGNTVLANTISRTGLRRDKFGEGVYIGSATSNWSKYSGGQPDRSDYNLVKGNRISRTGSESIDVKEGTTGGAVIGNSFDGSGMTGADSWVDVKGNNWRIEGNVGRNTPKDGYQTHRILEGWGSRNTFRGNTADLGGSSAADGAAFYIHDAEDTANVVSCDNKPATGNVTCTS